MDDEKLINLVECNDILYKKFNKDYRMPNKKRAVWSQISVAMEIPEEFCIKRWSSLRDRYTKEKQNEKLASGSGASFAHRWHYMNQLEFLAPHVVSRPVRSTINIVEENSSISKNSFEAVQQSTSESQTLNTSFSEIQFVETEFLESEPLLTEHLLTSPASAQKPLKQKKPKKRNETFDNSDQIFSDAVDTFKRFCRSKEEKERQKENSTIHAFGKMITATLNTMSENKQTRAIKLITDVLTQLKIEPE